MGWWYSTNKALSPDGEVQQINDERGFLRMLLCFFELFFSALFSTIAGRYKTSKTTFLQRLKNVCARLNVDFSFCGLVSKCNIWSGCSLLWLWNCFACLLDWENAIYALKINKQKTFLKKVFFSMGCELSEWEIFILRSNT